MRLAIKLRSELRRAGFTLIELMIVIAIIGVLAAVAVPGFRRYQMTAKRAEAFTNLKALATSQKSFYAEWNSYIDSPPEPWNTSGEAPSQRKRSVAPLTASFAALGWTPEGDVFYDYDSCSAPGCSVACSCQTCFTATAWGDLDDDGNRAAIAYFEPSPNGEVCLSAYLGLAPPVDEDGNPILQTVAVVVGENSDDY
jgi:type IV pilus assembly protein PilA